MDKEYFKNYYIQNRKELSMKHKEYYIKNSKKLKEYSKKYYKLHKRAIKIKNRKYDYNNKEKVAKRRNIYHILRKQRDIKYKILCNLRTRLYLALKGNPKSFTTMKLVGCSIEKLKNHLQNKFKSGMSWANYGKWEIDHIIPCTKFDLSKSNDQRKCFHYTNLQPLWAKDNLRKGTKLIGEKILFPTKNNNEVNVLCQKEISSPLLK
jgi:hypothetical protein